MEKLEYEIRRGFHQKGMQDPIYVEGFSSNTLVNPYVYDTEICFRRRKISAIDRLLTEEEREKLRKINEEMEVTPWSRWSNGNHTRRFVLPRFCEHIRMVLDENEVF